MCDGVLLGCSVMVLVCPWFPPSRVVGTFAPIVTSCFMRNVMSFCGWLTKNFGDIFQSHFFSDVLMSISIVECSLFDEE